MLELKDRFRGMMLGTAVGDTVGLPAEGIPRNRAERMFKKAWHHRLILNKGMISDDTEHTIFVAQSILAYSDNPDRFAKRLGWCLKWWLMSLPAGIGLATGRAIFKLWFGFPPNKSGVYSAGNGPAMRVAPIGAFHSSSPNKVEEMTSHSTRITHTDPKAFTGSLAIARIAAWIVEAKISEQPGKIDFLTALRSISDDEEWTQIVLQIEKACENDISVEAFADRLGLSKGITGYIYHTVPVVLYAWYRHCGNYEATLTAIWNCGGDTDTTGAIVGAIAGLTVGEKGIPPEWINGIADWPRGVPLLKDLGNALAGKKEDGTQVATVKYFWPGLILRNILFFSVVILHGLRRLLPPY